ncbi:MAG TPA: enoyl-CoA hydratase-related protein [Thermomonospora sp.]|nr:enoyl-CoA hydratase-related protein [Thermomonospora sp.]
MADTAPGVRFEIADHVATVVIDRPHVLNAVDEPTRLALEAVWTTVETDPDVWAVVVTGAGDRAFCVGGDLTAAEQEGWAHTYPHGFGGLSLRTSLTVPVIARVNGYALGGGMEMVLACDLVIAADHAEFGLVEPRLGRLPLNGGPALLTRRLPHTAAMGLLLTGRRASAQELHRLGLVNEVVPAADLDAAVQRWTTQILACAPTSLRALKESLRETHGLPPAQAAALRTPAMLAALNSPNADEGVRAHQEKRPPRWSSP